MLKFKVFDAGEPATEWPLRNAYLVDSEGNGLRGSISFSNGVISCEKSEAGTAALCLQHEVGELGQVTMRTCLLPERSAPYLLSVELARHRLMMLYNKLEDWAMFELGDQHAVTKREKKSRRLFVEALCVQDQDPVEGTRLANEALTTALDGSEELALAHSELLLNKRVETNSLPRAPLGAGVGLALAHEERLRAGLTAGFDFVQLPLPWKVLAPEENEYQWGPADAWASWARSAGKPVVAGPVISFEPSSLPDWLYIWEHDFETVRDLIYEHIERVVTRYKGVVSAWNIVSGLHVNSHFTFNFEQLIDLTRMATMLVRKLHPEAKIIVELRQVFGEYYAQNPRSIPPMMYVDLLIQSSIQFDAFGVRVPMGQALDGQYTRDLMQLSSLLDQFTGFGKQVFLTVAVPSEPVTEFMIASPSTANTQGDAPIDPDCGYWRRPWSPTVQGHWLEAVLQIAMSKPFIEAVCWQDLQDHGDIDLPMSGLIDENGQPKPSFRRLLHFRQNVGLETPGVAKAVKEAGAAGKAPVAAEADSTLGTPPEPGASSDASDDVAQAE
ncbi:MAG: endo-1,4-beta-xylanase [Algisphaera sp.]